ncbi:phosphate starvation-inducible protein PhoH [Granulicatella balaenopterae]|uniref:PhoH-like protein n=2 Tax=Granulicatella balaenopterae TaxID=137733 RepID=A0A1H9GV01_9LACT|nr:phosphate starvation-inducible protein PhoH [Granulicatella balaenopterae]
MDKELVEDLVMIVDSTILSALFGAHDQHIQLIEDSFQVEIAVRGEKVTIKGDQEVVQQVRLLLEELQNLLLKGTPITQTDIASAIKMCKKGTLDYFVNLYNEEIGRTYAGKPIRAKTYGQQQYIHAIKKTDVIFGVGPAGTGKTYLAVVMAVNALKKGDVKKIILTRPAVEAGESLGFLPGDLKEKVDPYLRPIYDALYNIYGVEHTNRLLERGVIEIAPLAYMRGRTLEDAFIILDEAQNTTKAQMKMFLTRLGFGSKMIVNGDKTQVDLPKGTTGSGLVDACQKLKGINGIAFVEFDEMDVVRHPIVSSIINAYKEDDEH